jgi:hypothetical protein
MAAIAKLKLLASRKAAEPSLAAAPPAAAAVDQDDLPVPSNINTVFLGGLFLLAIQRRPATRNGSSNPPPSGGESGANLTFGIVNVERGQQIGIS